MIPVPGGVTRRIIDPEKLPGLAYELAAGLAPVGEVLGKYGLSVDDAAVDVLLRTPEFERLFVQAREEWTKAETSLDRVRLKARRQVEDKMHVFAEAIDDDRHPLGERTQAFKALAKIAGAEDPPPQAVVGAGERFVVNITIPSGPTMQVSSGAMVDVTPEKSPEVGSREYRGQELDIFGNPLID